MIRRALDWLGNARRINTDINDEMQTLKFEVEVLRWANKHLREELTEAKPLIAYALKRKASLAKHDKKRGRA
mgnify:CR=1 FL=1